MKKIAIIGSRTFDNYDLLKSVVSTDGVEQIISGGAKGADSLARDFAAENGLPMLEFLPDYKTHGRSAPFVRNSQIVEAADIVYAFWDGKSTGTLDSLKKARTLKKTIVITMFEQSAKILDF